MYTLRPLSGFPVNQYIYKSHAFYWLHCTYICFTKCHVITGHTRLLNAYTQTLVFLVLLLHLIAYLSLSSENKVVVELH